MRRLLTLLVLAVSTAVLSEKPAQAWYNFGLNTGIGFRWRAGNNSYLWGTLRSGQAPWCYPYTGPTSYWENLPPAGCFPSASAYFPGVAPVQTTKAASRQPAVAPTGPAFQPTGHFQLSGPGAWSSSPGYWNGQ